MDNRLKGILFITAFVLIASRLKGSAASVPSSNKLYLIDRVDLNRESFSKKIIEISNELGFNPNWLMATIDLESGFDHTIENSLGYTGLIQFGETARNQLNVTKYELKNMSNVAQLDYVKRYFQNSGKLSMIKEFIDVYLCVFFPAAVGKPSGYIFESSKLTAKRVYDANPLFQDGTGKIKKYNVRNVLESRYSNIPKF